MASRIDSEVGFKTCSQNYLVCGQMWTVYVKSRHPGRCVHTLTDCTLGISLLLEYTSTTQRVVDRPPLTIIDYSLGGAGSWGCMSAIHVARVHFNWSSPTTLRYPSIPFGLSYHPTTDPKTQRGSPSALKTAGLSVTGCNQYRCTAPSNMAASYVHWLDIPQT